MIQLVQRTAFSRLGSGLISFANVVNKLFKLRVPPAKFVSIFLSVCVGHRSLPLLVLGMR